MTDINYAIKEFEYAKKFIAGQMANTSEPSDDDLLRLIHLDAAFEAFRALCLDDITGYDRTQALKLMRDLNNGFPLSPIEDVPEIWNEIPINKEEGSVAYQCSRYSALFKTVYSDGRVEFDDVCRCKGQHVDGPKGVAFTSGRIRKIVNEHFPITMPYMPPHDPYVVICLDFKYDENDDKNDWDTQAFFYIEDPYTLEKIPLDIYEGLNTVTNDFEPISKEEYLTRHIAYLDRMQNQQNK